ncbi:MAG: PucR family transcriptional regulator, partial [Candidatus Bipolaricaulaceae bacterium]
LYLTRRYIRALNPRAVFWRQGTRLIAFFPLVGGRLDRQALIQALGEICQRVAKENAPHSVSMGISEGVPSLDFFSSAYRSAMQSLEFGRALYHQARGLVVHAEDLGLFRLLSSPDSLEHLGRLCEKVLSPLLQIDESGVFLETLRVYLECGRNLRRTAENLGIHYNTARYRINRIRSLLGLTLESPTGRLTLEVALQILPLLRSR